MSGDGQTEIKPIRSNQDELPRADEDELIAAVGLAAGAPWRPRRSGITYWHFQRLHQLYGADALGRALALAGARHEARHGRRPAVAWLLVLASRLLQEGRP